MPQDTRTTNEKDREYLDKEGALVIDYVEGLPKTPLTDDQVKMFRRVINNAPSIGMGWSVLDGQDDARLAMLILQMGRQWGDALRDLQDAQDEIRTLKAERETVRRFFTGEEA